MEIAYKRNLTVATILSILGLGLGQVYNGQIKKGIIFCIVSLLLPILLCLIGLQYSFYGIVFFVIFLICFRLFIIIDALFVSIKIKEIILRPYNKWYVYLIFAVLIDGIFILTYNNDFFKNGISGVKACYIPSSAMEPVLLVGDYIMVDLKCYKTNKPQRGDIIVFKYPKDPSKDFIKRVIGTEGEKVEIIRNKIYVNEKLINDPWGQYDDQKSERIRYIQPVEKFGPVVVPKDSLFVLGDNRDNSQDSRFWGFVNTHAVRGKAFIIYFSWDRYAQNLLDKIRWVRFGKMID
jgi:signal peptidase I